MHSIYFISWKKEKAKIEFMNLSQKYMGSVFFWGHLVLHRGVGEGATPFPGLLHFTLDMYLVLLSVEQGSIKYRF